MNSWLHVRKYSCMAVQIILGAAALQMSSLINMLVTSAAFLAVFHYAYIEAEYCACCIHFVINGVDLYLYYNGRLIKCCSNILQP